MANDKNIFKIISIIFGVILLVLVIYLAYDKYSSYEANKLNAVYLQGYNKAINESITQIYQRTDNCGAVSIFMGNVSRNLADVDCLNKALEQAKAAQR